MALFRVLEYSAPKALKDNVWFAQVAILQIKIKKRHFSELRESCSWLNCRSKNFIFLIGDFR